MATKFRFATDGFSTVLELDGKAFGSGVRSLEFHHEAGKHAELKMELDLYSFRFLPDGDFDKVESALIGSSDQVKEKPGT